MPRIFRGNTKETVLVRRLVLAAENMTDAKSDRRQRICNERVCAGAMKKFKVIDIESNPVWTRIDAGLKGFAAE